MIFEEKYLSCLFFVWLSLLYEILGNMCIVIVSDVINQAVFSACPKRQDRNLNILRTKRAFKMK